MPQSPHNHAVIPQEDRFLRRNFAALLVDYTGYYGGMTFVSASTILPLFVRQLTNSNILIGLIPAILVMGISLPPILLSQRIEDMRLKRNYVLWCAAGERLPWLLLPAITLYADTISQTSLLFLFFLCLAINASALGAGVPAYFDLVQKVIPSNRRGMLLGVGAGLGGLLSLPGSWAAEKMLNRYSFPTGYAYCFLTGFVLFVIGAAFIAIIKEPESENPKHLPGWGNLFHRSLSILKKDRSFFFFNLSQVIFAVNYMAAAFYTVFAISRLQAQPGHIAIYTGVLVGASTLSSPGWGYVADRWGNRRVLFYATLFGVMTPIAAVTSESLYLFGIVFALSGLTRSGVELAGFNIVMEFAPAGQTPTYAALKYLVTAPAMALAPVIGGIMADLWGYTYVFYVAIAGSLASLLAIRLVAEPRWRDLEKD